MATILPQAETQFTDALGVPLNGGTVAFYAPGTTTPKNTWQDANQILLNSNPVLLDSAGRAVIFGSGAYRQVVKDQYGNLIWDQTTSEPISGTASFGGTSTGTVNAQVVSAGTWSGADGSTINFTAGLTNTGAMTITVGAGGSPIAVLKNGPSGPVNLAAGDIAAGNIYSISYSVSLGTFQLLQSIPPVITIASQAEAVAGTNNTNVMTPLRTSQAIGSFSVPGTPALIASWPFRFNPAGTLPEYAHPLAMGNFSGLKVQATSDTSVTVTGAVGLSVTANITASGANGLDTGSEAPSTWYNVWVIWNGTTAAALLSTSATAPTMPSGYVNKVRVGAVRNNASSNLWRSIQYGRQTQIIVGSNPTALPILASGAAGNISTPTWVALPTGAFVPPTASTINICPVGLLGADNNGFMLAPNNSYGSWSSSTNPPPFSWNWGQRWGLGVFPAVKLILESTNVYWASTSSAGMSLIVSGWEDNL